MPVKVKVAERLLLTSGGFSTMIVCGGLVSAPSKWWIAGVGSTLPARSIARTSKLKRPSSMSGTCHGLEQPTHCCSGGIGSHGAIGSGASVELELEQAALELERPCRRRSWLSVPVNVKAIVSRVSWIGPVRYSVSGGTSSSGGGGPDELEGAGVALAVLRPRDAALVGLGAGADAGVDGEAPAAEARGSASGRRCRRSRRARTSADAVAPALDARVAVAGRRDRKQRGDRRDRRTVARIRPGSASWTLPPVSRLPPSEVTYQSQLPP